MEERIQPNRLAEQRIRSRLTQAEVAKQLGITKSAVQKHEAGIRIPTRAVLEAYAKLFKVSTIELFLDIPEQEGNEDE